MVRTQIQLTEQQARLLRELSRTSSEPIAALIRRAIVGKYKAGVHDISMEHDRYLEEAFRS
jgi:hypothetical protein